jgi:hypothetical protein
MVVSVLQVGGNAGMVSLYGIGISDRLAGASGE